MPRGVRETRYFVVMPDNNEAGLSYKEMATAADFRQWLVRKGVTPAHGRQGFALLPDGRRVLILKGKLIRLAAITQPL